MRGVLLSHQETERISYLCDSFAGFLSIGGDAYIGDYSPHFPDRDACDDFIQVHNFSPNDPISVIPRQEIQAIGDVSKNREGEGEVSLVGPLFSSEYNSNQR
jgi:hypothetical protein